MIGSYKGNDFVTGTATFIEQVNEPFVLGWINARDRHHHLVQLDVFYRKDNTKKDLKEIAKAKQLVELLNS